MTIKSQPRACSIDGEQFRPVVVDILFGTDDVRLMQRGSGEKSTDVEIKRNLSAADLAGLDGSYYLDLPGNPRDPECTYETWGKERMTELGLQPSIYARVTSQPGQEGIVVQYWYLLGLQLLQQHTRVGLGGHSAHVRCESVAGDSRPATHAVGGRVRPA